MKVQQLHFWKLVCISTFTKPSASPDNYSATYEIWSDNLSVFMHIVKIFGA